MSIIIAMFFSGVIDTVFCSVPVPDSEVSSSPVTVCDKPNDIFSFVFKEDISEGRVQKFLLQKDISELVRYRYQGEGLLQYAVRQNNERIVHLLLLMNYPLFHPDDNGNTPITIAIECKRDNLLVLLRNHVEEQALQPGLADSEDLLSISIGSDHSDMHPLLPRKESVDSKDSICPCCCIIS